MLIVIVVNVVSVVIVENVLIVESVMTFEIVVNVEDVVKYCKIRFVGHCMFGMQIGKNGICIHFLISFQGCGIPIRFISY